MFGEASKRLSIGILGAGACLILAACASSATKSGYPTFAAIPPAPTDVRPPQAWRDNVAGVSAAGAKLNAETAPSTFSLTDSEAFADTIRRRLDGRLTPAERLGDRQPAHIGESLLSPGVIGIVKDDLSIARDSAKADVPAAAIARGRFAKGVLGQNLRESERHGSSSLSRPACGARPRVRQNREDAPRKQGG